MEEPRVECPSRDQVAQLRPVLWMDLSVDVYQEGAAIDRYLRIIDDSVESVEGIDGFLTWWEE